LTPAATSLLATELSLVDKSASTLAILCSLASSLASRVLAWVWKSASTWVCFACRAAKSF